VNKTEELPKQGPYGMNPGHGRKRHNKKQGPSNEKKSIRVECPGLGQSRGFLLEGIMYMRPARNPNKATMAVIKKRARRHRGETGALHGALERGQSWKLGK